MTEIIAQSKGSIPTTSSNQDIGKLAGESGISLIGKFGGRTLTLVGQIAVARILGPALFGVFSLGTTIFRLVQIFAPLGITNGVIWFGSKYSHQEQRELRGAIIKSVLLTIVSGGFATILFYVLAPVLAQIYGLPELTTVVRWFSISLGFITFLRVSSAATRISQIVKYSVILEDILQPLLFLIFVIIFYLFGGRLLGALLANLISFVLAVLLSLYYLYKLFFYTEDKSFTFTFSNHKLLAYSIPTAFIGLLGSANNWIDRLIIGLFRPAQDIGYYQAASQVSMMFFIILSGISSIIAPMIANLHHRGEFKRVGELYLVSTKWGLYLGLPAFIVLCFNPKEVMYIFGNAYAAGAVPLVILSIGQLINLSTGTVGFLIIMSGKQNVWLKISAVSLVINVFLNLLFTSWFGVIGTAISTTISVSFMFEAGLIYARLKMNYWPYDRRYLKGLIGSLAIIPIVYLMSYLHISSNLVYLFLVAITTYLVFFAILLIIGLDVEDKEIVALIQQRLNIGSKDKTIK